MALTRKFLAGMGITAEQIDAIIEEHSNTVEGLKDIIEKNKETVANYKTLKAEYDTYKKETEGKAQDSDEWKVKYEAEHKEFEKYKGAIEAKETASKVEQAYRELLKANNIGDRFVDSIIGVTKFDEMKLTDDGKLEDAEKLTESIKEKWAGFVVTESKEGTKTANPPKAGATKYTSREEIMKIKDTTERQNAIMNNPQLFGN